MQNLETYLAWVPLGLAALAAVYGLHRLALYAEERGWIYYHHKRGSVEPSAMPSFRSMRFSSHQSST